MKKRIICIVIATMFIVSSVAMFGCSNGGFEPVCHIEFTTNGKTETLDSRFVIHYSAAKYITEEEYEAAPSSQDITGKSSTTKLKADHIIPKAAKNKTKYVVDSKETATDNLKRYYWSRNIIGGITQYFECEEMYKTYYYIYVKVVNDTTIVVRDDKGDTTYTVSSYRITKFN